ncbi:MAG: tRNA uridine-5-carboxymethylaminomethyl(34) synthesis enzyme MnmG [Clostridia bacterium]|nr:tRNA uridine-5-carboxymethylaminomethyl(34) synthesis enzyme MnmG [Clostridia bacterium]
MANKDFDFEIIVIGAGHAGCESALACAKKNHKTLCLATNLDTVAYLACNPSIGGTAKGQIVKEIDALGGQMALNADKSLLQLRMLNRSKGPAVYSPRAQVDKNAYHFNMKQTLERTPNLFLRQGEATKITQTPNGFTVSVANGLDYFAKAVIVATGVYLNSKTIVGKLVKDSGPNGFMSATELTNSLKELGFKIMRFKTGTPARINARSIDFDALETQQGEETMPPLSYLNDYKNLKQFPCYLSWTTPETKDIILQNKHLAPLFSGDIEGVGPRYCPSIEDKVVRFSDKERHQIFLEPEGKDTDEYYVQGVSSSMPAEIQYQIYRSILGLEQVEIMRDAYAIEYDCIDATQLYPTLMAKHIDGLFFAGQINGTSGYEEAAGQGLVAGINASLYLENKEQLVLKREEAYIGVLIDDLTTKGTNEPYRMMTGRAEHRLVLRQDNADVRLTEIGRRVGLVDDYRYQVFLNKQQELQNAKKQLSRVLKPTEINEYLTKNGENELSTGITVGNLLKRAFVKIHHLVDLGLFDEYSPQVMEQIEIEAKYEGYILRAKSEIESQTKTENKALPIDIDYDTIGGLRLEARQKLNQIKPMTIGQASRISGVSPADISVLLIYLAGRTK